MRLIDANALKVQIQREIDMYYNEDSGGIHTAMEALDEIDNAPTVEINEDMIIEYCRKRCLVIMTAEAFADLFMNRRIDYEFNSNMVGN